MSALMPGRDLVASQSPSPHSTTSRTSSANSRCRNWCSAVKSRMHGSPASASDWLTRAHSAGNGTRDGNAPASSESAAFSTESRASSTRPCVPVSRIARPGVRSFRPASTVMRRPSAQSAITPGRIARSGAMDFTGARLSRLLRSQRWKSTSMNCCVRVKSASSGASAACIVAGRSADCIVA